MNVARTLRVPGRHTACAAYKGICVTSSDGSSTTASDGRRVRDKAPGLSTSVRPSRLLEKAWVWP